MSSQRRTGGFLCAVAAMAAVLCCRVGAADFPERPLRAIVPFSAGASNDTLARLISPALSRALAQQVIVENRPGADGRIGIEALTRAAPDGHTILFSGGAVALIPALRRTVPYDPVRDVQPVAELGNVPYAIAVHPQVPAKSVAELVRLAKQSPGKLNGASGGNSTFMSLVLFQLKTGTRIVNLPYKGTGEAALAVMRGEADVAIMDVSAFAQLPPRRVRILAITGEKRSTALPNVQTTKESGLADYTVSATFSVFTTGRTPPDIVRRLNSEISRIVVSPEISKRLLALGVDPSPKSVEDCTRQYLADLAKWKDVVARAGIPQEN